MHPQTVNPNRLIAEAETLLRSATAANVDLVIKLSSTLDPARVDPTQFDSAVLNLVVNAREAISGAGRIVIETRNVEISAEEAADQPDIAPGRYVLIAVSDTGRGIQPDIMPRVFDPFFTTKGVGEGSGIGLSQVYGFARESGGHVKIRSEVGVGTTVSLYLPHSTEHEPAVVPKSRPVPLPQKSADETVLVVEDERIVLAAAIETIRGLGYRVVWAVNAGKALEILKSEEPVDILFSDVVMPGMSGVELARCAREMRRDLPVLLASGYSEEIVAGGAAACFEFVRKPYDGNGLARALQRAVDQMAQAAA
jgi:CheY-like chemotaxis protein